MKEFAQPDIQKTKDYFISNKFKVEKARIGKLEFEYFVIPQKIEPTLPDFAYRMTGPNLEVENRADGIFGVSDSVPEALRPYWVLHEVIEFTQIGITVKGRCKQAEQAVLILMPTELQPQYIQRRIAFFSETLNYFKKNTSDGYTQEDVDEVQGSLNFLKEVESDMNVKAGTFHTHDGSSNFMNNHELQDREPDRKASITSALVGEYKALQKSLGLVRPVISYPASGEDISLSVVFPDSETFYIDPDTALEKVFQEAHLPSSSHLITQSGYDYTPPLPVDLVVLRNNATGGDTIGLIKGLKDNGYVISSAWGTSSTSHEILSNKQFRLIGYMEQNEKEENEFTLNTRDTEVTAQQIAFGIDGLNQYSGRGYVFQKIASPTEK